MSVLSKDKLGFQFKPLTICPLPPRSVKRFVEEGNQRFEEYRPVWETIVGDYKVLIQGSTRYGFPFGRDILTILYLIKVALEQDNNGVISFNGLKDYLDLFAIDTAGGRYKAAANSFKRIRYATWYWEDNREGIEKSVKFDIIKSWNVWFDEDQEATNPMFESVIELSKEFWDIVKQYKIPYKIEAVKKLKQNPTTLNLYLYLVYRTHTNWLSEKSEVFIPFFGSNGLKNQMSSGISRNADFKKKLIKSVEEIRDVWDDAPFYLKEEKDSMKKGKKGNKKYKDGLFIHVNSTKQLHVSPHYKKRFRVAIEDSNREKDKKKLECPTCSALMTLVIGKVVNDGIKKDDYWFCSKCKEPFYRYKHPELYDSVY